MPIMEATSRSDALTAIPSSRTRQASFTTGKNIISTMSFSVMFMICKREYLRCFDVILTLVPQNDIMGS